MKLKPLKYEDLVKVDIRKAILEGLSEEIRQSQTYKDAERWIFEEMLQLINQRRSQAKNDAPH
jgi:hypothetical protein